MKTRDQKPKQSGVRETSWRPLAPDNWNDFEALFGERGACGGCWCMTWRRSRKEFEAGKGAGNREAMREIVASGSEPGILLYRDSKAVAWCSVAPREQFPALQRSRVWAPVDEKPVWSVTCFFVAKPYRNQGITLELLRAAAEFAAQHGAKILEGYPQELDKKLPDSFVWTGLSGSFRRAGFKEAARRSKAKPIMRLEL